MIDSLRWVLLGFRMLTWPENYAVVSPASCVAAPPPVSPGFNVSQRDMGGQKVLERYPSICFLFVTNNQHSLFYPITKISKGWLFGSWCSDVWRRVVCSKCIVSSNLSSNGQNFARVTCGQNGGINGMSTFTLTGMVFTPPLFIPLSTCWIMWCCAT